MKKENKCQHRHIVIRQQDEYIIPQGWKKLNQENDVDLEKFIKSSQIWVFCKDCGKTLEEN